MLDNLTPSDLVAPKASSALPAETGWRQVDQLVQPIRWPEHTPAFASYRFGRRFAPAPPSV